MICYIRLDQSHSKPHNFGIDIIYVQYMQRFSLYVMVKFFESCTSHCMSQNQTSTPQPIDKGMFINVVYPI